MEDVRGRMTVWWTRWSALFAPSSICLNDLLWLHRCLSPSSGADLTQQAVQTEPASVSLRCKRLIRAGQPRFWAPAGPADGPVLSSPTLTTALSQVCSSRCCCGRLIEEHVWRDARPPATLHPGLDNAGDWSMELHTRTSPTNAFGTIDFQDTASRVCRAKVLASIVDAGVRGFGRVLAWRRDLLCLCLCSMCAWRRTPKQTCWCS